tara:strand:- start:1105 stop:1725 length:621 start_codon:yes stop_codon:yes gene_type:complete
MSFAIVAAVGVGLKVAGGIGKMIKGGADKRKAMKANESAKAQMEKDKEKYMNMDTSNPYLNMENTMEDLTVNTQAADMANEQNQVGMANTLSNMNKAAGGSGVAALAQAMANSGQIANQKASVSIAQQEKGNQASERSEASRIQGLEREGEIQSRNMKQSLAATALELSSGEVTQSANDISTAQASKEAGIDAIGSAVGSYASGVS